MAVPNKARPNPHSEKHFTSTETVRDIVIGMSDGLTVPFALAAGLTGAVSASHIIIAAGMLFIHHAQTALLWSTAFTIAALAVFGYVKGGVVGARAGRSAMQTVLIGGVAATAAFLLARAFS